MNLKRETYLYDEPIDKVIANIEKKDNNVIFLWGNTGCGKTTVVNKLITNNNYIDISLNYDEQRNYYNNRVYNLYYLTLIADKIYKNLALNNSQIDINYGHKIHDILTKLDIAFLAYHEFAYFDSDQDLDNYFLNNPEKVIELLYKNMIESNDIKLVLDHFDEVKDNSKFQQIIFATLKKYFNSIYVTNDISNISNDVLFNSSLVEVNYAKNIDCIFEILDRYTLYNQLLPTLDFSHRIRLILDEEDIYKMIKVSNGNIKIMKNIIYNFYTMLKINAGNYKDIFNRCLNNDIDNYKKIKRTLSLK